MLSESILIKVECTNGYIMAEEKQKDLNQILYLTSL